MRELREVEVHLAEKGKQINYWDLPPNDCFTSSCIQYTPLGSRDLKKATECIGGCVMPMT